MTHNREIWVRFVLTAMAALSLAAPVMLRPSAVLAQTVATTTSTVDVNGFITVVDETRSGALLVERRTRQMTPAGFVLVDRTEQFWPSGLLRSVNDVRNNGSIINTVIQSYDQNGIIRAQFAESSWVGGVLSQKWIAFDAAGGIVSTESRTLTTAFDGTLVWNVTMETLSNGVPINFQTSQQPFSVALAPPAWFADALASTVPPAPPAGGNVPPAPAAGNDEDDDDDEDEDDDDDDDDEDGHRHRHRHGHGHGGDDDDHDEDDD